jgi:hypothetical protein
MNNATTATNEVMDTSTTAAVSDVAVENVLATPESSFRAFLELWKELARADITNESTPTTSLQDHIGEGWLIVLLAVVVLVALMLILAVARRYKCEWKLDIVD